MGRGSRKLRQSLCHLLFRAVNIGKRMYKKIMDSFCGHGLLPEDVTPRIVGTLSLM
jgi:hypothetical protein